jgi:hypothetical protein
VTAALLPARLRDAFALRYGEAEREEARKFIAWADSLIRFCPLGCVMLDPTRG